METSPSSSLVITKKTGALVFFVGCSVGLIIAEILVGVASQRAQQDAHNASLDYIGQVHNAGNGSYAVKQQTNSDSSHDETSDNLKTTEENSAYIAVPRVGLRTGGVPEEVPEKRQDPSAQPSTVVEGVPVIPPARGPPAFPARPWSPVDSENYADTRISPPLRPRQVERRTENIPNTIGLVSVREHETGLIARICNGKNDRNCKENKASAPSHRRVRRQVRRRHKKKKHFDFKKYAQEKHLHKQESIKESDVNVNVNFKDTDFRALTNAPTPQTKKMHSSNHGQTTTVDTTPPMRSTHYHEQPNKKEKQEKTDKKSRHASSSLLRTTVTGAPTTASKPKIELKKEQALALTHEHHHHKIKHVNISAIDWMTLPASLNQAKAHKIVTIQTTTVKEVAHKKGSTTHAPTAAETVQTPSPWWDYDEHDGDGGNRKSLDIPPRKRLGKHSKRHHDIKTERVCKRMMRDLEIFERDERQKSEELMMVSFRDGVDEVQSLMHTWIKTPVHVMEGLTFFAIVLCLMLFWVEDSIQSRLRKIGFSL